LFAIKFKIVARVYAGENRVFAESRAHGHFTFMFIGEVVDTSGRAYKAVGG
jgi:hypothetical protein